MIYTGLILRCDRKVGNPFQTKQGSRPSCRAQEGRKGSEEGVPEILRVPLEGDRVILLLRPLSFLPAHCILGIPHTAIALIHSLCPVGLIMWLEIRRCRKILSESLFSRWDGYRRTQKHNTVSCNPQNLKLSTVSLWTGSRGSCIGLAALPGSSVLA